jgi:ParB family transcriptional regulator, chromosome partitioning protein
VGKSRASVANSLRLLSLDAEIQGFIAKDLLSVGHAKALLGSRTPRARSVLARRVIEEGLSVRMTEKLGQAGKAPGPGRPATAPSRRATRPRSRASRRGSPRTWGPASP